MSTRAGTAPRGQVRSEIERFLLLLHPAGSVFEIRVFRGNGKKRIGSGYFTDATKPAEAIAKLDAQDDVGGIYVTLNPVKCPMLARAANRIKEPVDTTSKDSDIRCRTGLIFDVDPVRADDVAGIAATDDEVRSAQDVAEAACQWLRSLGWPDPIKCDSGNGRYLVYRIDLPNDQASESLLKQVLLAVHDRVSTDKATVDLTMFNASRIIRVMGTKNRKGDSLPDRPHRRAALTSVPDGWRGVPVSLECLEAVAGLASQAPAAQSPANNGNGPNKRLRISHWLADHGIDSPGVNGSGGRTKYRIPCPFNPDHGTDAAIFQGLDGKLGFKCFHNGCADRDWQQARDAIGRPSPEHYDPPQAERRLDVVGGVADVRHEIDQPFKLEPITTEQLWAGDFTVKYHIEGAVVARQPGIVGGPSKSAKTVLGAAMVLSLSSGKPFLGKFPVPKRARCCMVSAESGFTALKGTTMRIGAAQGCNAKDYPVIWIDRIIDLGNRFHVKELQRVVKANGCEFLILDPVYLLMPGLGDSANNLFAMAPYLIEITNLGIECECTPLLLHHFHRLNGDKYRQPTLEMLSHAGFANWARWWVLLNRRSRYQPENPGIHELWVNLGGSAGFSSAWALDVDEGLQSDGRWNTSIRPASEACMNNDETRATGSRDAEEASSKSWNNVLVALRSFPLGATKAAVAAEAHINGIVATKILGQMSAQGIVRSCTVKRDNGRKYPAFILAETHTPGQPDTKACLGVSGCNSTPQPDSPL